MRKKKDTEEFFAIYNWMITDLRLKGSELLLYGIIYSFCKDGETMVTGLEYLANRTAMTTIHVCRCLNSLQEKKVIIKEVKEGQKIYIKIDKMLMHHKQNVNAPLTKKQCTINKMLTVTPYICNTNVLLNNNNNNNNDIEKYSKITHNTDTKKTEKEESKKLYKTKNKQEKESQTDSYAKEILSNQSDRERMCMALKIDDDFLSEQLTNFCDEVKVKEKTHADFKDFKSHFFNWLRIQIQTAKQHQNGNNQYHTTATNCFGEDEAAKQQRLQSYTKLIQDLRSGKG